MTGWVSVPRVSVGVGQYTLSVGVGQCSLSVSVWVSVP